MSARAVRPAPAVTVREMGLDDLTQVLEIETRTYPVPWTRPMLVDELGRQESVCLIAQHGERLVGYLLCSGQAGVWHVLNVAVHPRRRGEGIGRALMDEIVSRAGGGPLTLEVRVSNARAIRLYRSLGFLSRGRRRRYYSDNAEDALIMWRGAPIPDGPPAHRETGIAPLRSANSLWGVE